MKRVMNYKGYTLVELIVVMAIFIIIIIATSYAFENILKRTGQQAKSAESDISGMVGLEIMRADIAAAGYGLPWVFQATPTAYKEIADGTVPAANVLSATDFDNLRDVPPAVPRAITSATGSSTSNSGIDYLVVKGAILGINRAARKWNYVNYSSSSTSTNISYLKPRGDPATDLASGDRAITIESTFTTTGSETKQLLVDAGNSNAFQYTVTSASPGPIPGSTAFQPGDNSQVLVAYGIRDTALLMPYNRVDFYVDKTAAPPVSCSSGTGVLTKAVADHSGGWGGTVRYPLLDCVGDMKISYDLDPNNDGNITQATAAVVGTMTAAQIRTQIKNVRVFILAHEGKKDPSYSYPVNDANNVICVGPINADGSCSSLGRSWSQTMLADINAFGSDWLHYRWKVYYFVVNLKNLQQ
jgi:type II secretory pathway pseudopilin PulG